MCLSLIIYVLTYFPLSNLVSVLLLYLNLGPRQQVSACTCSNCGPPMCQDLCAGDCASCCECCAYFEHRIGKRVTEKTEGYGLQLSRLPPSGTAQDFIHSVLQQWRIGKSDEEQGKPEARVAPESTLVGKAAFFRQVSEMEKRDGENFYPFDEQLWKK